MNWKSGPSRITYSDSKSFLSTESAIYPTPVWVSSARRFVQIVVIGLLISAIKHAIITMRIGYVMKSAWMVTIRFGVDSLPADNCDR